MAEKWAMMFEGSQENLKYEFVEVPIFPYNIWDHCQSKQFQASVVIVNHQRKEWLDNALWSILYQETNFEYEIILVDDASTDGMEKMLLEKYENLLRSKKMKFIKFCGRLGWMKPMFIGAMAADTDIIITTQSDVIQPRKNGMQKLMDNLTDELFGVFTPCKFIFSTAPEKNLHGLNRLEEMGWRENPEILIEKFPGRVTYVRNTGEPWPFYAIFKKKKFLDVGIKFSHVPYYDNAMQQYTGCDPKLIKVLDENEALVFHIGHPHSLHGYWWHNSRYSP